MSAGLFIAILAAGAGQRFGGGKLDTLLLDQPLGRYSLDRALQLNCGVPSIIIGEPTPDFAAEAAANDLARLIPNPCAAEGLASSVTLAAQYAAEAGSSAMLLMLADMPLVTISTLEWLVKESLEGKLAATRHPDGNLGIPACFPSSFFEELQRLEGDRGAGALLRNAQHVSVIDTAALELKDVDTPADLAEIEAILSAQRQR